MKAEYSFRVCNGDFFFRLRTWFFRPYLDSRLRETTCSYETHASSLVLFSYMQSNTLTTIPCTTTHSYAEKSLSTSCLWHRPARLTSQVRLVLVQPGSRSSRLVRTTCNRGCVRASMPERTRRALVKAPGAVRGAQDAAHVRRAPGGTRAGPERARAPRFCGSWFSSLLPREPIPEIVERSWRTSVANAMRGLLR